MMMCSCICSQRRGQRTPSAVHQTALAFRHWSSWQGWLDKVQKGQPKLGESLKVSSSLERIKGHCWPYRHNSWLSSQHYYLIDLTHFEVARSQLLSLFAQLFQPCLGQFVRLRHLLPWIIDLDPGHCDCIPCSTWWLYFSCWKAFAKSSSSHMLASKEWTASLASPAASDRVLQRSCWRSQSSPSSMQDASASELFLGICHAMPCYKIKPVKPTCPPSLPQPSWDALQCCLSGFRKHEVAPESASVPQLTLRIPCLDQTQTHHIQPSKSLRHKI